MSRALKAIDTMLNSFIEDTLGGRRTGTENAQKFLEEQIRSYEERLRTAENRLAEFKKTNVGLMPTEQGGYFERLQVEIDEANKLQNQLSVAEARRAELARQLRGDAAVNASSAASGSGGALSAGSDTLARIKETQARIDDLLQRYTDKHPDVIAARNTLDQLTARREAELASLRRGDAGAAANSGASSNPVYQSILLQINQADVEITSLRGQLAQRRAKATELRQRLDIAPKVEAEFAQLNRDYEINKAQYTTLLANYEKSRLGERADNAGSVRFETVQPPTSPYVPVAPHRILLLVATFFVALLVGGALTYLLHLFNPVVGSLQNLMDLIDAPVLGVVSSAFPDRLRHASPWGALSVPWRFSSAERRARGRADPGDQWLPDEPDRGDWHMSVIERAMDKIRLAGNAAPAPLQETIVAHARPSEVEIPAIIEAPLDPKIFIDREALRLAGYLPESDQDRRFADEYRHIKRPLLVSAFGAGSSRAGNSCRAHAW